MWIFMRLVLQRVKHAQVNIGAQVIGRISQGLLIFLAVAKEDANNDADSLVQKVFELRVFEDTQGKMNLSAIDVQAEILVVSQFTLLGDCRKGRRPSFDQAAEPSKAEELYNYFIQQLRQRNLKVETGQFRAMMDVELVNDGPVTFLLESKKL